MLDARGQARQKFIFPLEDYKPSVPMVQKLLRADTFQSTRGSRTKHPYRDGETMTPKEKRPSIDKPKLDARIAATSNTDDTNRNNSVKQPDIEKLMNKSAKSKQTNAVKEKFRLTKLAKSLKRDLDKETTFVRYNQTSHFTDRGRHWNFLYGFCFVVNWFDTFS
ncbi:hypothetical protein CYY_010349 [Polysphondylium violaceum]|uniref:Uncharacterized protein n=1 Tax=Polysphondylium violaceum TaxID=133409 RepID=A0A8J4UNS3_9MYCE|nr:hypothetical protein CYY_010349 [Polysphondylium violaceum]